MNKNRDKGNDGFENFAQGPKGEYDVTPPPSMSCRFQLAGVGVPCAGPQGVHHASVSEVS
jgi:hypothetical protein